MHKARRMMLARRGSQRLLAMITQVIKLSSSSVP